MASALLFSLFLYLSRLRPVWIQPNPEILLGSIYLTQVYKWIKRARDYDFFYIVKKRMCVRERNLARGKHQHKMLKQGDGPSVLNNLDHKLTSKGETFEIPSNFVIL